MAGVSHQTVRLSAGRHKSPGQGACVMELASMLAGEPFSDRPRCADPVIASFLRSFNDRLGHARRQELRPYAAAVVGTRTSRRVAAARRRRCLRFACGHDHAGPLTRLRIALLIGIRPALRMKDGAAEWAAREAGGGQDLERQPVSRRLLAGRCVPAEGHIELDERLRRRRPARRRPAEDGLVGVPGDVGAAVLAAHLQLGHALGVGGRRER